MSKNLLTFILFVVSPVDSIKRGRQTENYLASEIYVQEIFLLIHNWLGISAVLEILRIPLGNRDKTSSGRPTVLTSWAALVSWPSSGQVPWKRWILLSCSLRHCSQTKPQSKSYSGRDSCCWSHLRAGSVRDGTPGVFPACVTSLP